MKLCLVPAGPFLRTDEQADGVDAESVQGIVDVPEYWIGKYPVTLAQFREFVADMGYTRAEFWVDAGSWQWQPGRVAAGPSIDEDDDGVGEGAVEHDDDDSESDWLTPMGEGYVDHDDDDSESDWLTPERLIRRGPDTAPVSGVTWLEAVAFCRWLTMAHLPPDLEAVLPSEAEWEKAARGGIRILATPIVHSVGELGSAGSSTPSRHDRSVNELPARPYPWGTEPAPNCSVAELSTLGPEESPPVGLAPKGASPYGVEDLSGCIWQFTRTLSGRSIHRDQFESKNYNLNPAVDRNSLYVIKGGAYWMEFKDLKISYSLRAGMDEPFVGGFRVVVRRRNSSTGSSADMPAAD